MGAQNGGYPAPQYDQAMMGGQPTGKGGSFNAPDYGQQGMMSSGPSGGKGGGTYGAPNYNQMAGFAGGGPQFDPRSQWAQSQGYSGYGPTAPPTYEQATQWGGQYGGGGYGGGYGGGGYGGGGYGGGGGYNGGGYPQYPQGLPPMGPATGGPPGPNPGPPGGFPQGPTPGPNPSSGMPPAQPPPQQPINPLAPQQVTPTEANQAFGAVPSKVGYSNLTDADAAFVDRMQNQYARDLKGQAGGHSLYTDMFGSGTGVNAFINATGYDNPLLKTTWNPNDYNGPLKAKYEELVRAKGGTPGVYGSGGHVSGTGMQRAAATSAPSRPYYSQAREGIAAANAARQQRLAQTLRS